MADGILWLLGVVPDMISAMYDYSTETLKVFIGGELQLERVCSYEVAKAVVIDKYGFDPGFVKLNSE